jgi:MOSC domain-containing protein YiiM
MNGRVVSVSCDGAHRFSKQPVAAIRLIAGLGVEGDAHSGETVQHRSRVATDPSQPNLRQVHLLAAELLDELAEQGFGAKPADLGENITTRGIDLIDLPRGALLHLGKDAVVEVTGLRNPCGQIDQFRPGMLKAVLGKGPDGTLVRKAGVMGIVLQGGEIAVGAEVRVKLPPEPHRPLERV